MHKDRVPLYQEIERLRDSKVILLVNGDRPAWETQLAQDAVDLMPEHLDVIGDPRRISLLLHTRGGETLAAWRLVNLIRLYCEDLEVIIPSRALSAGTLVSLGANRILMTKQATLGPIDPSVHTPLNPQVPGGPPGMKYPVNVEQVKGYIEMAKEELGTSDSSLLQQIFLRLSEHVHPLVLGEIFRARSQIQYLAKKLIVNQIQDPKSIDKAISFLCIESGSHDYTINRKEAKEELGLAVESLDDELYPLVRKVFADFRSELGLNEPYDPNAFVGPAPQKPYKFKRCLIESVTGGEHAFVSEGELFRTAAPGGAPGLAIEDRRSFEGWKKES